jgi:K(+)-stimulated pyrophosphate-energized sodium pump
MTDFILQHGFGLSIAIAFFGLATAVVLFLYIRTIPAGTDKMREVAEAIQEGAKAYLNRQVATISVISLLIGAAIWFFYPNSPREVTAGFFLGAICSLGAGYAGMRVAVMANVRTAQGATISRQTALRVAFNGGAVTGLLVVGLGLLSVGVFYLWTKNIQSLIGLALGSSLISVFARLGGGIYTKAADVGADLVGKLETHLEEDDPRTGR